MPDNLVEIPCFSCQKPFFLQQSKPGSSLTADSQKGEDDSIGCLDIFSIGQLGVPSPWRQKHSRSVRSVDLRKNWKVLFKPNLRIIIQEEILRKLQELSCSLEVKMQSRLEVKMQFT